MKVEPMKKKTTNNKPASRQTSQPVHIEFDQATARSISIIGTFNDWRHKAAPMTRSGGDRWFKELVLPPGVYEYQFLVDGKWMPDPQAAKTAPNPFGEVKSILKVNPLVPGQYENPKRKFSVGKSLSGASDNRVACAGDK
jgi:1,4-alpha-glucan branching enzyme